MRAVSNLNRNRSFGSESGIQVFVVDLARGAELEDFSGSRVEAVGDVVEIIQQKGSSKGVQQKGSELECTLRVRHGNQGQVSVSKVEAGGTARLNLGSFASYSSGAR